MYGILITLHIILVGLWLSNLLLNLVLKLKFSNDYSDSDKSLLSFYLKYVNIIGIIGTMGVLITGIIVVVMNPAYGFFVFSDNHWLASKQIIMLAILGITFAMVIPTAKAVREVIINQSGSFDEKLLRKLSKINWTINILVVINLLFALSRRML
jgi:hypothetical protein